MAKAEAVLSPPPVSFFPLKFIIKTGKRIGFAIGHLSHVRGVVDVCEVTSDDAEGRKVDAKLKTIYSVVLPICGMCMSRGAKVVVGR